jgi:hypothetical protein
MKIGSVEHKKLFCGTFIETYQEYKPESLPWPDLDEQRLQLLRGIPFWQKVLDIEREAGAMVGGYAATVKDRLMKEAIALQGREETRHANLIKTLIDRYQIEMPPRPPVEVPQNIEPAFTTFGFEECLNSFFAFGLLAIAREANIFPEQLFTIFDPILDEKARHIVFFVNWFTYTQIARGQGLPLLRGAKTLWYYSRAVSNLIGAFGGTDTSGTGFTATGATTFTNNLTAEKFLAVCIRENEYRMSKYDSRLLQPRFLPRLATTVLRTIQLLPKRKPQTPQGASA